MASPVAMFAAAFVVCVIFSFANGVDPTDSEKESIDIESCVQEFNEWCTDLDQSSVSFVAISYYDGEQNYRVYCSMNSNGTNCTKNGSPWFYCTPSSTLYYKGQVLTSDTADGEVCETKDKAENMFNGRGITIRETGFNQTAFDIQRKIFEDNMKVFRERMRELQTRLYNQLRNIFGGDDEEDFPESKIWTAIQPSADSFEREQ